jgi:hypothetical protein
MLPNILDIHGYTPAFLITIHGCMASKECCMHTHTHTQAQAQAQAQTRLRDTVSKYLANTDTGRHTATYRTHTSTSHSHVGMHTVKILYIDTERHTPAVLIAMSEGIVSKYFAHTDTGRHSDTHTHTHTHARARTHAPHTHTPAVLIAM